jgi:hypothetical protein
LELEVIKMAGSSGSFTPDFSPKLPFGRQISDFLPLTEAETKLVYCCANGEACELDKTIPARIRTQNSIRAGVIRFLLHGGDRDNPVHEFGIWIIGAVVKDQIDISMMRTQYRLIFEKCKINDRILMRDTELPFFATNGSIINGITGDRCRISGDFQIRDGTVCCSSVKLVGCYIGDSLDCTGSRFEGDAQYAIVMDRATIEGSVLMRSGFDARSEVSFIAGKIGGSFTATGGTFRLGDSGDALSLDRTAIEGHVFLRDGFIANGTVRLLDTIVSKDVECHAGRFDVEPNLTAVEFGGAMIGGRLSLEKALVNGHINLTDLTTKILIDQNFVWQKGAYSLAGIKVSRFGKGKMNPSFRRDWLKNQSSLTTLPDPHSSPWIEVINALSRMGRTAEKKKLSVYYMRNIRPFFRKNPIGFLFYFLRDAFNGFGHYPFRSIIWAVALSLFCTGFYWQGERYGYFGPTDTMVLLNTSISSKCGIIGENKKIWTSCINMPEEYTTFHPFFYSLDLAFPFVDLKQEADWAPVVSDSAGNELPFGSFLRYLMWLQILTGWAVGTYVVAVAARLVQDE